MNDKPVTRTEVEAIVNAAVDQLIEHQRGIETSLLTAFHAYQKSAALQFRRIRADVSNIDTETQGRLEAMETRIAELEKRLPPSAAK